MRLTPRRLASLAGIILIGAAGTAAAQQIGQDKAGNTFILPPGFPAGSTVQRASEGGVYITPPGGMTQHLPGGKVTPFDNSVLRFQKAEPFPHSDPNRQPVGAPLTDEELGAEISGYTNRHNHSALELLVGAVKDHLATATRYSDGSISVHEYHKEDNVKYDPKIKKLVIMNRDVYNATTDTFLPDGTVVHRYDDFDGHVDQSEVTVTTPKGVIRRSSRTQNLDSKLKQIEATTETTSIQDPHHVRGVKTTYDPNNQPLEIEMYSYHDVTTATPGPVFGLRIVTDYKTDGAFYDPTGKLKSSYHIETYTEYDTITTRIDYAPDGKATSSFRYNDKDGTTSFTKFNADGSSITTRYKNGVKVGESKGKAPPTPPAPKVPKQAPTVKPITPPKPKGTRVSSGLAIITGPEEFGGSSSMSGVPLNSVPKELRYITPPPRDTRYTVAGAKARLAKLKKRLDDPKLTAAQRTTIQSQIDGIERFTVVHGTEADAAGTPAPRP